MYVRTASERDLQAIRSLLVEAWHATYDAIFGRSRVIAITDKWHSLPALAARLDQPNSEFLLADDGQEVAGMAFAAAIDDGRTVILHQLYVRPSRLGRGIGSLLLQEIEDCFPEASRLRLEVEEANDRAVRFYISHGFEKVGSTADCGQAESGIPAAVYEKPVVPLN